MDRLWLIHALALVYANAFVEQYNYGYPDADREMWGIGYASAWGKLA